MIEIGQMKKRKEISIVGFEQLREKRKETIERWSKMGLLEGLEDNVKENCAQLFENQFSHKINEKNKKPFSTTGTTT